MNSLRWGVFLPINAENIETMKGLGLTYCQAKIYLSLLNCEIATAKQISTISGIAREEVYQILPKLHCLGMIEKILERPIKYRPIPLRECIKNLVSDKKNRIQELETKAKKMLHKYEEKQDTKNILPQSPKFVFVPSNEALIRKLRASIIHVKSSICISTSCKRFIYACDCLHDLLQSAWDRDVKGQAIITNPKGNHLDVIKKSWSPPLAKIRYTLREPKNIIAMYDKKEVFIFTNPEADLKDSPALWSNYPSLVSIIEDYFERLWVTSTEIPSFV